MKTASQTHYYGHDHLYSPAVLMTHHSWASFDDSRLTTVNSRLSAHDQLYSPVALVNSSGADESLLGFIPPTHNSRLKTHNSLGNPYLFTGREVDYLDNGSLTLQYNRHRYYSQSLGRWTSEDPLGIDPAGRLSGNAFGVRRQYRNGTNIYQYVNDIPTTRIDSQGLECHYTGKSWMSPPSASTQHFPVGDSVGESFANLVLGGDVVVHYEAHACKCEKVCCGSFLGFSTSGREWEEADTWNDFASFDDYFAFWKYFGGSLADLFAKWITPPQLYRSGYRIPIYGI